MKQTLQQIMLLTSKDLRIEARSRQTIGLVVILGILIIVVLGLGLGSSTQSGFSATAILWVAYLFGGVLCFEKTMAVERNDDALAGLLLAPMDRGAIYAGKLISNMVLMLALAIVVTPAAILFFHFDLSKAPFAFALIMVISMLGFAAVGTLFSAAISSSKLQGGFLAMLIFPVSLPLVIGSTQMLMQIFGASSSVEDAGISLSGLGTLIAFDVVFLVASWIVFEVMLEP